MVVGKREESVEEKRVRHIKEMTEMEAGWERELLYAVGHEDSKYEKYCRFMIQVCKNTLSSLKKYEI